jgi:hypothetical protein
VYPSNYQWVEKNTRLVPVSIRVRYECLPWIKNCAHTRTRRVGYPTGTRTRIDIPNVEVASALFAFLLKPRNRYLQPITKIVESKASRSIYNIPNLPSLVGMRLEQGVYSGETGSAMANLLSRQRLRPQSSKILRSARCPAVSQKCCRRRSPWSATQHSHR